jgi:membrane fusion protein, multidrug efflux system
MNFNPLTVVRAQFTFLRSGYGPVLAALGMASILGTSGCKKLGMGPPGMGGGPGGAVEVNVLKLAESDVTLAQQLPGRVSAFRDAEVRARVDGVVLKRYFEEGGTVKEGEVLYQIDPAPYEAALAKAKASLAKSEANVKSARTTADRYKKLLEERVTSQQDYEDSMSALTGYEADVQSDKANVLSAEIDLGYTRVTAPVSGRIGKSEVTEGAYVRSSDATLLATVRQLDTVYVDVTRSSAEILRLKKSVATGELQVDESGAARVRLILEDGSEYPGEGALKFTDVAVDTSTSSVTIRAVFANPDRLLLPGMFVRARLVEGTRKGAILVPQEAVARNPQGKPTALVVDESGKASQHVLVVSRAIGNQWLVDSGLKAGDTLIVDNLQSVSDGTPVKVGAGSGQVTAPKNNQSGK